MGRKLLILFCMIFSLVHAQENQPISSLNDVVKGYEECGPCLPPRCPPIFPDAGPRVCCSSDFYFLFSYIYWTAREDHLSYAYTGLRNSPLREPSAGHVYQPNFGGDNGFKVGIGASLPHDGWDFFAQYTWLHNNAGRSRVSKNRRNTTIRPLWFVGGDLEPNFQPRSADGTWKLQFNVVDTELGRNFFVSQYMSIRPFCGIKGSWQDQDYLVRYTSIDNILFRRRERLHIKQFYWGVGPRSGFDFDFHFNKYWTLFGSAAFSALWGKFEDTRHDTISQNHISTLLLNTEDEFYTIKPVGELIRGIRFEIWFARNTYHLAIEAAYEQQIWWGQNQFYRTVGEGALGSLGTQGVTAQLRLDY